MEGLRNKLLCPPTQFLGFIGQPEDDLTSPGDAAAAGPGTTLQAPLASRHFIT